MTPAEAAFFLEAYRQEKKIEIAEKNPRRFGPVGLVKTFAGIDLLAKLDKVLEEEGN